MDGRSSRAHVRRSVISHFSMFSVIYYMLQHDYVSEIIVAAQQTAVRQVWYFSEIKFREIQIQQPKYLDI